MRRTIDECCEDILPVLLDQVVDVAKDSAVKALLAVCLFVGLSTIWVRLAGRDRSAGQKVRTTWREAAETGQRVGRSD